MRITKRAFSRAAQRRPCEVRPLVDGRDVMDIRAIFQGLGHAITYRFGTNGPAIRRAQSRSIQTNAERGIALVRARPPRVGQARSCPATKLVKLPGPP
jgi:hypothetical protein